jgi:hypothetical protein
VPVSEPTIIPSMLLGRQLDKLRATVGRTEVQARGYVTPPLILPDKIPLQRIPAQSLQRRCNIT